jgi:hypothetical protein
MKERTEPWRDQQLGMGWEPERNGGTAPQIQEAGQGRDIQENPDRPLPQRQSHLPLCHNSDLPRNPLKTWNSQ